MLSDVPAAAAALRLGASTTLAHHVLPRLVAEFQRRWPAEVLTVQPANSALVAAALTRGALDLGFVEGTARHPGLHYEQLLFDEPVAMRGATRRYRCRCRPPWRTRWCCAKPARAPSTCWKRPCKRTALPWPVCRPQPIYADTEAIKDLLRATPGTLGFISRRALVAELVSGQLEEVPIRGLQLACELLAVWRSGAALPEAAR